MNKLIGLRVRDLHELLRAKKASCREILDAHLTHIKKNDANHIDAFICLTEELAMKQAQAVDEKLARGEALAPLAGIPVAIKDNMCVPGYPTTCSSKILAGFIPSYTNTAVARLFDQGAICVGKTNLDEFAMGSSTENSSLKPTRNPWNTQYVPGGSSGGSAAAVAAGFAVAALGSDTGGSIRQPASFCGVIGMKPTYGVVSRFGLVAFASSLDQIGPFGSSVEDVAHMLSAIAGHDRRDSTSLADLSDLFEGADKLDLASALATASADELVKGKRIGIIKELLGEGIEPDVQTAVKAAAATFEKLGAIVEEVSIPTAKYALPVYYILATAEASANLARFDGVRYGHRAEADDILTMYMKTRQEGFGQEVKRRIMLGTYALSSGYYDAYYKKAQQVRRLLKEDFDKIFEKVDCVISPTSPSSPFKLGEKTGDPLTMYLSDIATIPANLAGLPGISVPCGFGKNQLPIGLQILGKPLSDARILRIACAYERATDFTTKQAPTLAR
ncbi:MAG TPA: Asp-tRNA(Asn)/Glu-tRNA(Gln) amidotransferase subunit GatA [Trichormus sp.]